VEGIAAGGVLGDQVRAGELGQQRPHLRDRDASEAGGGAGREVGAGVEPEQPEQLRRASAEGVVGPGEHRPQVGGGVPGVELVEAVAGLAELVGQGGERELWVGGGAGGDDGQRQGQPRAAGDELVGGVGFGDDPVVAEPAGQQLHGFVAVEQVEGERLGASGDQARELVAAGHQQQAAGCAGQQRGDLVGVAGVVQQDQHAFAGQQAAVQACLGRQADGDLLRRHLQRVQESPYRLGGYHRRPGRVEPAQVDVQLAIGEPVGDPVRPVDRQGGLADASGPGDHGDHHRARRRLVGVVEQPVQRLQRHLAAAERVGVGGELPWHHPSRWRTAWQPGRPAGEQVGVDPLQLRAGVGAELLGEADPDRLVPLQRLGRPAGPLQNHQQAHPQRLPQREALGQLAQLGHQVDPGPAGQIQVDAPLQAGQVSLLQPRGLRMFQPVRSHPLERGAPPQPQRRDQPVALGRPVGRGRGQVQEAVEAQRVHLVRLDRQRVPAAAGGDQLGAEQATEASHIALHVCPGVDRQVLAPYRGRQPIHRHRLARRQRQHRQQRRQPAGRQLDRTAGHRDLQRPQQPDLHVRPGHAAIVRVSPSFQRRVNGGRLAGHCPRVN
jgi:hypothetical protein